MHRISMDLNSSRFEICVANPSNMGNTVGEFCLPAALICHYPSSCFHVSAFTASYSGEISLAPDINWAETSTVGQTSHIIGFLSAQPVSPLDVEVLCSDPNNPAVCWGRANISWDPLYITYYWLPFNSTGFTAWCWSSMHRPLAHISNFDYSYIADPVCWRNITYSDNRCETIKWH